MHRNNHNQDSFSALSFTSQKSMTVDQYAALSENNILIDLSARTTIWHPINDKNKQIQFNSNKPKVQTLNNCKTIFSVFISLCLVYTCEENSDGTILHVPFYLCNMSWNNELRIGYINPKLSKKRLFKYSFIVAFQRFISIYLS